MHKLGLIFFEALPLHPQNERIHSLDAINTLGNADALLEFFLGSFFQKLHPSYANAEE